MSVPNNSTCPHCKLPLREYHDFITCPTCQTSYHDKCWEESNGCTRCSTVTGSAGGDVVETVSWYLYHSNKNLGPLTWEELCSQPGIQPDDLVWNSRLPDWIRADQLPNLPLVPAAPVETDRVKVGSTTAALDSAAEKEIRAMPVEEKKPPALQPGSPGGALQRRQEETAPHTGFSPGAFPEAERTETAGVTTLPAANEYPQLAPPPPDGVIKWKLAETAASRVRRPSGPPAEETGSLSRNPARTEQILDHLYKDQPAESQLPPEPSFLDRKEDYYDKRSEKARSYADHIFYGILLALVGSGVGAATYLYAADWESMYYTVAIAAGGSIALFGIIDLFRGLFGWLKYRA